MYQLPKLYKQTNTGALQEWSVSVHQQGSDSAKTFLIQTEFGKVGGKIQETADLVSEGKNIGKANETTIKQQAELKAKQLWDQKIKSGYVESLEQAAGTINSLAAVKPMLAHVYEDHLSKVVFPAYTQPKLDGIRLLAVVINGKAKLYSRTQKPIETLPHIIEAIEALMISNPGNWILDGECYNHDFKDDFNRIISLVKRKDVHPDHKLVQYHIYDIAVEGRGFAHRNDVLRILVGPDSDALKLVQTDQVHNQEELEAKLAEYLEQGYEGAMYRNPKSHYEGKRSSGLLKVKTFKDDEFEIIGVEEGHGKLMGKAGAFVCLTNTLGDRKPFKAKMKGTLESLTDYLINKDKYLGKFLTVKFQNYTPDSVPRFPIGMRVRADE